MRHLFLTLHEVAFGEVLLGVRLAQELADAGDEVMYLAPRALAPALRGAPLRVGTIDHAMRALDVLLPEIVAETGADTVCLVDAQSTFASFAHRGFAARRIFDIRAPIVALDAWDLATAGLFVDFGGTGYTLDPRVLEIPALVPVPFARPTAKGAYRALPRAVNDPDARAKGRARLGVSDGDSVILMPSAAWQHREAALGITRPSAEAVPKLLARYVAELGAKLVHIGPWRFPGVDTLGDNYLHIPQVPRQEFAELLAAADLLLSLNAAATTIGSALAAELPVLLLHHDAAPPTVGPLVAEFVRDAPPIVPFRAWPCGLRRLLGSALAENPFTAAVPSIELLDEAAVLAAGSALLRDRATRDAQRSRAETYVREVEQLPTGRERYFETIRSAGKRTAP